jgi:thiamine-phosphate pyrophosphorylase
VYAVLVRRVPRLILVTDRHATGGRDLLATVDAALAAGLPAVQLRDKDLDGRTLWRFAESLRTATRRTGALLFVNDRIDVALAVEADGVHLGSASLPLAAARAMIGPAPSIGVSIHAATEVEAAALGGADFAFFGPVYATPGKTAVGLEPLAAAASARLPILAIGGVTPADVPAVRAAGAVGVAVIRAILAAPDPDAATRTLLAAVAI